MSKFKLWAGLACFVNAIALFCSFLATWKKERSLAIALLAFSAASSTAGTFLMREYEKDAHTTLDEPFVANTEEEQPSEETATA